MSYDDLALAYAEKYGIVEYDVRKNIMVYNVSYPAYLNVPRYTVQHRINLDTGQDTPVYLKRYDKRGEYNRG